MHPLVLRGAQVVVGLLALFGGFATKVAPPPESYSTGFASFLLLIVFLITSALARKPATHAQTSRWIRRSIVLGISGLFAGLAYLALLSAYVFEYPATGGVRVVRGLWSAPLTATQSLMSPSSLLAGMGGLGNIDRVWSPAARYSAELSLVLVYTLMLVFLFAAVFGISEGVFGGQRK